MKSSMKRNKYTVNFLEYKKKNTKMKEAKTFLKTLIKLIIKSNYASMHSDVEYGSFCTENYRNK